MNLILSVRTEVKSPHFIFFPMQAISHKKVIYVAQVLGYTIQPNLIHSSPILLQTCNYRAVTFMHVNKHTTVVINKLQSFIKFLGK